MSWGGLIELGSRAKVPPSPQLKDTNLIIKALTIKKKKTKEFTI